MLRVIVCNLNPIYEYQYFLFERNVSNCETLYGDN